VRVIDATAGLGRDSFLLACLGCRVTAIERSPVLAVMLRDGLERAKAARIGPLSRIIDRIELIAGDAREWLGKLPPPDVVYLDPMYPDQKKSALSKKEMRICRRLVGDDEDAAQTLAAARAAALRRTVVKRHRDAPPLAPNPAVQFKGRAVRYDVYLSGEREV
jgi:16S rRNA (guanine1516-N2)-methyltransferase